MKQSKRKNDTDGKQEMPDNRKDVIEGREQKEARRKRKTSRGNIGSLRNKQIQKIREMGNGELRTREGGQRDEMRK